MVNNLQLNPSLTHLPYMILPARRTPPGSHEALPPVIHVGAPDGPRGRQGRVISDLAVVASTSLSSPRPLRSICTWPGLSGREGAGGMGWRVGSLQGQPAERFSACSLLRVNLPCTLGGASVGWARFSLANSAAAQPASHVGPFQQLPAVASLWFGEPVRA